MKKRDVLGIIVAFFGLWCIISFIGQLPTIVLYLFMPDNFDVSGISKSIFRVIRLLSPAFTLSVGVVFLARTRNVVQYLESRISSSDQTDSVAPTQNQLSFWIALMGLFYLVSSSAALLSLIPRLFMKYNTAGAVFMYSGKVFLPEAITWIFSLILITNSGKIERLIVQRMKKNTQQIDGSDS
jgi:hypothetical protein